MEDRVSGVRNEVNLLLTSESPTGPMAVSFGPPIARSATPGFAPHGLKADIDRWRDGKYGRAEGPGQWPPATVGPCVVTERRMLFRALAWALLLPIFPTCLLLLVLATTPLVATGAYVAACLVISLSPTGVLLRKAWRDRRRLRRAR